jgi:hypothetical protein
VSIVGRGRGMPSLGKFGRKVMGLPEPRSSVSPQQTELPRSVNPWEIAGAKAAESWNGGTPESSSTSASGPAAPWVHQEEKTFGVFARRLGRGLVWVVLALACITGLRSWFFPPQAKAPLPPPATTAPAYPTDQAQAVASRFARAYLEWDKDKAQERAQLLASVLPSGADMEMGWDGHGRQDVEAVQPGAVTLGKARQARVRVDVLTRPYAEGGKGKKKDGPTAEASRWLGLEVPVVETGGRVIVTGEPGLVGISAKGPKTPDLPTQQTDAKLSGETKGSVDKFFRAFAEGDTEGVTAPGASLPALPEGVKYTGLASWSADRGSTDEGRAGTARVTWSIGGASIEQTYRVELTRVSSVNGQRWQVADVHGGSL